MSASAVQPEVAFFDRTYEEALGLTRAVRDYIAEQAGRDRAALDPDTQLVASCEEMRMTARMTQVMAWLLVQRAVHAGEMTRAEAAADQHRLGGHDTCLAEPALPVDALPDRLVELLGQTRELYQRIERLDRTLDGVAAG